MTRRQMAWAVAALVFSGPSLALSPAAQTSGSQSRQKGRLFAPRDLGLLNAPDREAWQKPELIMDELQIADGSKVADLGAGDGWFTIQLARRVGPNGIVYSEDIQPLMIVALRRRVQREGLSNVTTLLGTAADPRLPRRGELDAVLIVDAFDEMDDPSRPEAILTFFNRIAQALKPQGRLGVIDFLPGAGGPGPAPDERPDPERVINVAAAAQLRLQKRETLPPFSFLLVFGKETPPRPAR